VLPGKKFTPEDIVAIATRRYWFFLIPFAVIASATVVVARILPDYYQATTTIQVVPQQVPEDYVKASVTTNMSDRLDSIAQTILSRTNLERIITDLNLYVAERRTGIMEDIVSGMRTDIHLHTNAGETFTITYSGRNPKTVKDVTERLASLFIDQNMRDRQQLAEGTDQFLDSQLEDARRLLADNEQKVAAYRTQHSGELPSQLQANLEGIQSTEMQIQALVQSVNQDRQQRLLFERQLKDLQDVAPPADAPPPDPSGSTVGTTAQQLAAAQNALAIMQTQLHFADDHPDVKRQKQAVATLQKRLEAESLARPVSSGDPASLPPGERARRQRVQDVQADMDQLDRSIAQKLQEEDRLRKVSAGYQQHAQAAPQRETEMIQLTRDYGTVEQLYTSLLAKKEESKIAADLERRQIGEQFSILDAARLPERPYSPNRQQISLGGVVAGLCVGLALVGALEYRDRSFRTDAEVTTLIELPVLAAVPLMRSAAERRRRLRRIVVVNTLCFSLVAACLAVVAYTLVR